MGAVGLVATTHLRNNRRSTVLVALMVALTLAFVLAAFAGARRTDQAVPDLVAADKAADGYAFFAPVTFGGSASPDLQAEEDLVEAFDSVTKTARVSDAIVELSGPTVPGGRFAVQGFVGMEPGGLQMVSRMPLVDGRQPDETQADEILIDESLARDAELDVGSNVDLRAFTLEQGFEANPTGADGLAIDATVVGIVRLPTDLRDPQERQLIQNDYVVHQDVYLTSAFWDEAGGDIAAFNPVIAFDVAPGTDIDALTLAMIEEFSDYQAYAVPQSRFLELDGTYKGVERSASVHSRGLQVFGIIVALAGLFLVGQTLGRQVLAESTANPTLRSIGMTRRQLWQAALLRAAPVGAVGGLLGAAGAVALSPLTPLPGTVARRAELDPGLSVDVPVLVAGAILGSVLVVLVAALPVLRTVRTVDADAGAATRPTLASRLAARGLSPPATVGIRFALEPGRGSSAVPVRTTILTAAVALALLLATAAFSASLADTRDDGRHFGVTWDVASGAMSAPEEAAAYAEQVAAIPGVDAFAGLGTTAFDTPHGEIPTIMVRQEKGTIPPLITAGRAPGEGEVALGALTMQEWGLDIGDQLEIDDAIAGTHSFEVTGEVVLNTAGADVSIPPGRGGLFDWSMLALLNPASEEFVAPAMFVVQVAPGRTDEVEDALRELFPTSTRVEPVEPPDLTNLGDASLLLLALGAVVTILGVGTVAHAMLSAVRRRQRELAVLKTIGFVRSDTRAVVRWQAVTFGAAALVIGIPLGVALGRVAWSIAAGQLGLPSHPVVPLVALGAVTVAVLGALVLTAQVPARVAARVPAAEILQRD